MAIAKDKYRGKQEYALVYAELITAARYRGIVTYQEIAKLLGWPLQGNWMGSEIGHLLGEISEDEHNHNRPMLSAIVVTTEGTPGPGFFDLARNLGVLESKDRAAEKAFLEKEQKAVHKVWRITLLKK